MDSAVAAIAVESLRGPQTALGEVSPAFNFEMPVEVAVLLLSFWENSDWSEQEESKKGGGGLSLRDCIVGGSSKGSEEQLPHSILGDVNGCLDPRIDNRINRVTLVRLAKVGGSLFF